MTDLVDFLLARIAEDRATALTARIANGVWEFTGITWPGPSRVTEWVHDVVPPRNGSRSWDIHNYIAHWDPARVLAECEAKQRLVTVLSEGLAKHWGPREDPEREWEWCPKVRTAEFCEGTDLEWGPDAPCECAASSPDYLQEPLLRLFALPYADHPDYREEWKP